ncbi:restriction endonuclease subunit S [Vibrio aestuarianus]|uniref:restriction endonuclease subunit S n=1 Tax=Vibrio aestuarianus TaxID=28171 RepID=UPI00237CFEDA|nr:restriction endonuclease subunit S [Vibrio aestuarianus]MDE1336086.1 restriction endonuclease subunit S [Vibrio aestuarianus]
MGNISTYESYVFNNYFGIDLPEHWDEKRLGYLASNEKNAFVDGPFGSDLKTNDYKEDGIPLIQLNNIRDGKHILRNFKYVTEQKKNELSRHIARPRDIVLAKMAEPVARSAIVSGQFDEYVIVADCVKMTPDSQKIDLNFLNWAINSEVVKTQAELVSTGTTRIRISLGELKKLKVPYPSHGEQTQIANFLDHETAKIDTLIEKQQQLIKLLKEKRQAVISHAVTKGLLSVNGKAQAPMKDSGVEWLGEVPEHWDVLRLKHLIESLESGVSVNAADIPARTDEVGVLKTSCVYTRTFRAEENKTVVPEDLHRVKCPVRKGAIIISRMNTPELVGASALVNEDVSNVYLPDRLWQTNFNQKVDLDSEYLAHFMTVEGFRVQISLAAEGASSSMQNIAKEDYLSINCLLPPLSEQQQIVQYIRQRLEYFSKLDSNANNAVKLLKERRAALISAAVTGKIDVRNWQAPVNQEAQQQEAG